MIENNNQTPQNPTSYAVERDTRSWATASEALEAAQLAAVVRPLIPYPGWTFGADWDNPHPVFHVRRRIWEYFKERKLEVSFVFDWYDGLKLNLYLGHDLSRQLFIAG